MKIKITESQYKKIFLSGRYENLILEQAPVKVLDTFLDDISVITKYSGKTAAKKFATDFPDDVLRKIEKEFNVPTSTIKNFDSFKSVLRGVSDNPITPIQFQSLLRIKNSVIKEKLLIALSKDDDIQRILSLYKKAETSGRNDITQKMRERLKIYLGTDDEVGNFINKYKGTVVTKIEDLSYSLNREMSKMFNSIGSEENFLKLKNEATSLLRSIDSTGYKLFKDTKQWTDFQKAKEILEIISGNRDEFIKFKEFVGKNKIDLDLLKKEIKDKNPNIFSKILALSDSVKDKSKSIFYLFMGILFLSIASGLTYGVYKLYDLFTSSSSGLLGGSNDKIIENFKNNILTKKISQIMVNNEPVDLTDGDKDFNKENVIKEKLKVTNTPINEDETEYLLIVSQFSINGSIYNNAEITYNTEDNSYTLTDSGDVMTKEDIENFKDVDNKLKYKAITDFNLWSSENTNREFMSLSQSQDENVKSKFGEVYEITIEKNFNLGDYTYEKGSKIEKYVILWDNDKKSWEVKKVKRNESGEIIDIL